MTDVVVVGAGQAGLAVSHELTRAGVEHVVLEKGRVAQTWRGRWDSFCLVTPNWSLQLPGHHYDGDDPDGFDARDEVIAYLERYAEPMPVEEGVEATSLAQRDGGFVLETSAGTLTPRQVVLASGAYQRAHRPEGLPAHLDVGDYRNPGALPDGPVLVIGSGQSGCQIAEELRRAGRDVFLSCGRAPWAPRRLEDKDLVWWLHESGFLDQPVGALPDPAARLFGNVQVSGHGGGRDLNYRTLRRDGVTLLGRFLGADGRRARFAGDLGASVAWGDERNAQLMDLFRTVGPLDVPPPEPFDPAAPGELDLAGFGAVIVAGGYRPDYARWVQIPGAFDAMGFPLHHEGASTVADGLYFAGVHFLRKRKSTLFIGVGEDAAIVAGKVAT
ncbi:MAG: NAD(P)-binding domain-containing protein [Solirubrobacteraceae bacterium]